MFDDLLALSIAVALLAVMAVWVPCLHMADGRCRKWKDRRIESRSASSNANQSTLAERV